MFEELDTIELTHDIVEHGLKKGDLGAIVNIYEDSNAYEVEFVAPDGRTTALLTLTSRDIQPYLDTKTTFFMLDKPVYISEATVATPTIGESNILGNLGTIIGIDEFNTNSEKGKGTADIREFNYFTSQI